MATHPLMTCQNCKSPLKLDSSLEDLNPAAFDLLIGLLSYLLPRFNLLTCLLQARRASPSQITRIMSPPLVLHTPKSEKTSTIMRPRPIAASRPSPNE
jgi:hypothetical protein